jgi:hypothetical protein
VAGQLAADAEVARRAHEARAEDLLPEAVDGDARRERVLGREQPARKAEAIAGGVFRHGRQGVGRVGVDRVAPFVVFPAEEDIGHRGLVPLAHHMRDSAPRLDLGLLSFQLAAA